MWCVVVVVSLSLVFSNLKLVRSEGSYGEPLKHVITHMWAMHGKQKIVDKR